MEIGNEISHKIRSAIKAKLVELGAYEDEELPDYIMVMVANKKTHAQMNEDLHLFLGSSTEKFTSWLQTILNKLKSITIGNPSVMSAVVNQEVEDSNNSNNNNNDDTGVPELLVQTDMDEFEEEQEESNLSLIEKSSSIEVSHLAGTPIKENLKGNLNFTSSIDANHPLNVQLQSSTHYLNPNCSSSVISHLLQNINTTQSQPTTTNTTITTTTTAGYSSNKKQSPPLQIDLIASYSDKQIPNAVTGPLSSQTQANVHLAKVQPHNRKRRIPGSVIGSVIHHSSGGEEEEEYDPYNPSYGSVASVVRVTERKSSVPPELQANKCLLLKAVKEAHKSLASQEKRNAEKAFIKPMPQEVPEKRLKLSEKMHQKRLLMYSQSKKTNNLLPNKAEDSYEINYTEDEELNTAEEDSRLVECKLRRPRIAILKQATTPSLLEGRLKLVSDSQLDDDLQLSVECADSSNFDEEETNSQENSSRIVKDKKRQNPKTQFIVTLDGFDDTHLSKTSVPFSSEAETIETTNLSVTSSKSLSSNISDTAREDEEIVKKKKLTTEKISENCKFWPSCQNGATCKYQHPSVTCSKFPNCKFGDKCAYLHPKCKFDTKCNRFDCPFSHSLSRSTLPPPPLILPSPPPTAPTTVPVIPTATPVVRYRPPCKFFPTCKNMSCPFSHPKPCRFGISCTKKPFCTFYHPPLPKQNQLRWKADKSLTSEDAANLADQMELNLEQWNNPYKVVNTANS